MRFIKGLGRHCGWLPFAILKGIIDDVALECLELTRSAS